MKVIRRSWCEIDLSKIIANYNCYKKQLLKDIEIIPVVKADAYGHGAVKVASCLQKENVKNFAVSNISEAIELRESHINGQILILGYTPIDQAEKLVKYNLTQTLLSEKYAQDLLDSKLKIRCQFAIDTGMNRIGIDVEDLGKCEYIIRKIANSTLILDGIFTHLCVADMPSENQFTKQQINMFKEIVNCIDDLKLPYIHCLNSAGGLWYKDEVSHFARLGIILYGLKPDYNNQLPKEINPVLEWKSVISMIKNVFPGESVGYGRTYVAKKEMRVATIPTGYADGYNRLLSNKGYVLIHGKKAPILGRICMDQFMVDVSSIPEAREYEEVVLIGKSGKKEFTADDMANMIGTIGYEIICGISKRVPRIYI